MRWASLLSLLAACASPAAVAPPTDVPTVDTTPAPDVAPALDAAPDITLDAARPDVTTTDRVRVDVAPDVADASASDVPAAPDDVVIDPGMCGPRVRDCFCRCGANAVCQQACIANDEDCGFCIYLAATRCCASQSMVLDACIDASMCTNDPCIRERCPRELMAFEGCFADGQRSDPACQREVRGCLGADYPNVRCVVQR